MTEAGASCDERLRRTGVDPNVPKSNFALMSQQRIDARRYRMSAVLAAEIHAQRSPVGSELFDIKYLETVPACETINGDQ